MTTAQIEFKQPKTPPAKPKSAQPSRPLVWVCRVVLIAAMLGGWQWFGSASPALNLILSTPAQVMKTMWYGFVVRADWWSHLGITLQEAALGYLLGVVAAVLLVAIIVPSPLMARFIGPFVAAANALPIVVLAPMFIVWFGINLTSKIYFVALAIFFIVFHGIYGGFRSIDPVLVANAKVLGAGGLQLVQHVYAPAVLTWIVAGLRLSSAWALLAAVVAEYLGANKGIGFLVATGQQQLEVDQVIGGITVIAMIAVTVDRLLVGIEARFSKWRVF